MIGLSLPAADVRVNALRHPLSLPTVSAVHSVAAGEGGVCWGGTLHSPVFNVSAKQAVVVVGFGGCSVLQPCAPIVSAVQVLSVPPFGEAGT